MRILILLIFTFIISKTEAQSSVLNRADSLYQNGNFSKAIAAYQSLDKHREFYDRIAKAYVAIGNYDLAIENYKRSVEIDPKNALVLYDYAKLLSKIKQFEASVAVLNDLMNLDYRNPNYHYDLGLALERLKDSSAINRYLSTYRLDPTHQKAIYKLAKHYLQKGRHSITEKYINEGLITYENNVELISLKAQSYFSRKYYTKAQIWFEKLIYLGESSEFIHEKLSICYAQNYEYERAIEQKKKVLEYDPYNTNAILAIGNYYQQLNDFEKAEQYYKQVLLLRDVPIDYEYQQLGIVLNRQDKHKEAVAAFQKSLKENPENISSAFYIVTSKASYYSDIDAKIKLYEDFLKKYPSTNYRVLAAYSLKQLKEEKFLKEKE